MPDATDNRVLSRLILLQGTLNSMPTDVSISRFVARGLKSVPGVRSLNMCVRGAVAEKNDLCASCNYRWGEAEENFDYLCKLNDYGNTKCFPIRTVDRLYGFIVFSLNDTPDSFTPYEPYLLNIANVIAIAIDSRQQRQALEVLNKQLQREVEHRKRVEEVLAIQARIATVFGTVVDDEMFNEVLKVILNVMRSPFGVFGFLDENGDWVVPTMTRQIWDKCRVPDKMIRFPRETWKDSTWVRALQEKRTIHSNEPSANIPEGHVSIQRHISMPILFQGEAVGLFQVANKESDYTEADIRILAGISGYVAPLLNARLRRERAQEALRREKYFAESLVQTAQAIVLVLDTTGRIVSFNPYLEKISGHRLKEVQGKDWFSTFLPERVRERTRKLFFKAIANIQTRGNVTGIVTKDGREIDVEWYDKTLMNEEGHEIGLLAIGQDITERKRAEDKIKALLWEKELLLKEVHHRIKNNMSSMMSLLALQSNALKNPEAVAALLEARNRMRSMGMLYDKLYRSKNLREMSIKDYLPPLVDEIVGVFPNRGMVKIEKRIDDIMLGVKVLTPLGIIVNELITNAMKHAFAGREHGSISVSASAKDDHVTLIIEDDGIGIPELGDIENSSALGLQLVGLLTAQINGTIRIERRKGTRFVLEFDVFG